MNITRGDRWARSIFVFTIKVTIVAAISVIVASAIKFNDALHPSHHVKTSEFLAHLSFASDVLRENIRGPFAVKPNHEY